MNYIPSIADMPGPVETVDTIPAAAFVPVDLDCWDPAVPPTVATAKADYEAAEDAYSAALERAYGLTLPLAEEAQAARDLQAAARRRDAAYHAYTLLLQARREGRAA